MSTPVVEEFTYLESPISSTAADVNKRTGLDGLQQAKQILAILIIKSF